MTSDYLEKQWNKFTDKQKKQYALDLIAEAHISGRITEDESISSINNIEYFMKEHNLQISLTLINILDVVAKGDVRFAFENGQFITKAITSPQRYAELSSVLPMQQQLQNRNEMISMIHQQGLISDTEAEEAFADIMKQSIFENYRARSDGTKKVNEIIKKVITSDYMKGLS